ncbi:ribonuclease 2 precursor, putative [Entamoeba invadens IP1]|uniref:Ribonuclease 2, putative n=1 Tax=Entamoeba invadens IP1 TaxID=370355 RepID=A0A0A1U0F2_ENTIV|nr:ribonuclease 2 precursor, putative [Entamoeba invadens IP1]ELP85976.1 ribonuclease 2 precursor, putative [Entamoeba invadens IP1]|eukprot:XP_004185322.1 ribonuclease 2 precursor, putative [Entamoeba invadens IP1]
MFFQFFLILNLTFAQPDKSSEDQKTFPSLSSLEETLPKEEESGFTVVVSKKGKRKTKSEQSKTPIETKPPFSPKTESKESQIVRPKTTQQPVKHIKKHKPSTPQPTQQEEQIVRPKTQFDVKPKFREPYKPVLTNYDKSQFREKQKEKRILREELFPEIHQSESPETSPKKVVTPIQWPTSNFYKLKDYQMCKYYQPTSKRLELLVLVEYWPGDKCSKEVCSLPLGTQNVKEKFFLHGFWPQYENSRDMVCCIYPISDREIEKRMLEREELKQEVLNSWMSTTRCRNLMYQWDKHGTCSSSVYGGENGHFDYIQTALNLYNNIDFWKFLQESKLKVETEKMYQRSELKKVIKNKFGVEPVFNCVESNSVDEIRFCCDATKNKFNPTLRKCPPNMERKEGRKCDDFVQFKKFPEYLLDPKTAFRNNCEY